MNHQTMCPEADYIQQQTSFGYPSEGGHHVN